MRLQDYFPKTYDFFLLFSLLIIFHTISLCITSDNIYILIGRGAQTFILISVFAGFIYPFFFYLIFPKCGFGNIFISLIIFNMFIIFSPISEKEIIDFLIKKVGTYLAYFIGLLPLSYHITVLLKFEISKRRAG